MLSAVIIIHFKRKQFLLFKGDVGTLTDKQWEFGAPVLG